MKLEVSLINVVTLPRTLKDPPVKQSTNQAETLVDPKF